ncbi:hypothetical protein [Agrococcus terreus]|uniref:Lipoprotein n=1 Tax=Agrococcus terreus TaxID=574649 RepID=A0ABQ2KPL2_9MICO|nr:hypothetical protein [Agrococcus terreus]GGN86235.1 hypothetical protein GCM10010968_19710 [Agrococcus terreus]
MKTSRIVVLPALAAASLLALTGCFQLPPVGGNPGGSGETTAPSTDGGDTGSGDTGGDVDLAGTSWSGTDAAGNAMDLVLEEDGTVLLNNWNDENWDEPTDTWEVSGGEFTMFISGIREIQSLEYTGPAAEGEMQLTGVDGNGDQGYDLTLTQGG